ncbi:unnamed protein product [Paramecium primaurelia]|uniref:Trichocyst matrix protein n=1 Tax=Paramecium primaurelia TaxID=5886 RepID=A0A8S1L6Y3_PARPR|nr:unnamed protein product [Paramecium primaurelia]
MKIILLVFLIGATFARDEGFFAQLRNSDFGKTIIQTLQVQLSQEHPADTVVHLLKQMKDDLNNEQRVEDEEITGQLKTCQEASNAAVSVLTIAKERKATSEERLPLLQQEQNDKKQQLFDKQGEEQRNLDRISVLQEARNVQRQEFEQRRDELVGLVSALQEAKKILSQGIGALKKNSFVQLKNHHENFLKYYPNKKGFHSMVDVLLTVLQEENTQENAAQKVVKIIDTLVDSIFQVQKEEMKADDARELDFQTQKERLLLANRRLSGSVADLNAANERIGQKILEIKNDISIQDSIIFNKSTEQADWDQTCNDTEKAHRQQTEQRNAQLAIIVECIDIFETRFDMETKSYIQRLRF